MADVNRICVLVSATGRTMVQVMQDMRTGFIPDTKVVLVLASQGGLPALELAAQMGIPRDDLLLVPAEYTKKGSEKELATFILWQCGMRGVTHVVQYGWRIRTPREVILRFHGRMINQHGGPVDTVKPEFGFGGAGMFGRRVAAARMYFCHRVRRDYWTEAIAQAVDPEFDCGSVYVAQRVPFGQNETIPELTPKLLSAEYQVQALALRRMVMGTLTAVYNPPYWLVRPHELPLLLEAKQYAKDLYPHG